MADDRAQARREAATLLGVDIEHLSAADGLRVDMISALRLVIDSEQASILSGGSADLGKLNVAVQSLIALLPSQKLPETSPVEGGPDDWRTIVWENYLEARRKGESADPMSTFEGRGREIEKLRARVAELEASAPECPNSVPSGEPINAATARDHAVGGNVVPLRTDDRSSVSPSPPTATPASAKSVRHVADKIAAPPPPAAPAYDYNANQDWKSYVEPDGSIRSTPRGRWDA
jgi:hypothetical protein